MNQDMQTSRHHSRGAYPSLPRVAVGAVVRLEGSFLLVQRANPPAQGQWSIPGGKIRLGESMQQAAEREVLEETGLTVRAGLPVLTFDLIHRDEAGNILFHYVIVDLWAEYIKGRIQAGADAARAAWIAPENFPDYNLSPTTLDLLNSL